MCTKGPISGPRVRVAAELVRPLGLLVMRAYTLVRLSLVTLYVDPLMKNILQSINSVGTLIVYTVKHEHETNIVLHKKSNIQNMEQHIL